MRKSVIALSVATLFLGSACAIFAQDKPVLSTTFEDGLQGWVAMGAGGKSDLCYDALNVHSGKASLRYDYEVKKNSMSFLILPTSDGALAKAKSIHFWIKADYDAKLVISLQKAGGGRFMAFFTTPPKYGRMSNFR